MDGGGGGREAGGRGEGGASTSVEGRAPPPASLILATSLQSFSLPSFSLPPPFILQNKDYGFFTSGYFLEGKETRGTNYLAVSVTG